MISSLTLTAAGSLVLGVLLSMHSNAADEVAIGREVGMAFPDFELPTIDGAGTLRLSDLRGKRVLLIEFASW